MTPDLRTSLRSVTIEVGLKGAVTLVVADHDTAIALRSGSVPVLAEDFQRSLKPGGRLLAVVGEPQVGEDPAVDARMERLHPAVEHLRRAGDRGDVRLVDRRPVRVPLRADGAPPEDGESVRHGAPPVAVAPAASVARSDLIASVTTGPASRPTDIVSS